MVTTERRMQHEKRALIDAAKKCIPEGFELDREADTPTFTRVGSGMKYQINDHGFVVQIQRRA